MINRLRYRHQDWVKRHYLRKNVSRLRVHEFCVISNNCWGGIVYSDLELPYQSPFVNMFMYADCYLAMLERFDYYLSFDMVFTDRSKYFVGAASYPIGLLEDLEIHFLHYQDAAEANVRWNNRKNRLTQSNRVLVMSERDGCTESHIRRFDALPFGNKILFASKDYKLCTTTVVRSWWWIGSVPPADQMAGVSYAELDVISYLNKLKHPVSAE